jgi:hypothetical protein
MVGTLNEWIGQVGPRDDRAVAVQDGFSTIFSQFDISISSKNRIGGLVVKLAVAILSRTVSASPGFDFRPMHFAVSKDVNRWWWCC